MSDFVRANIVDFVRANPGCLITGLKEHLGDYADNADALSASLTANRLGQVDIVKYEGLYGWRIYPAGEAPPGWTVKM